MRNCILFFLVALMTQLLSGEVYSQAAVAGDNSSKLFNEGGYVKGITAARAVGLAELVLGLSCLVIALRAKKRAAGKGALIALGLGFSAMVFSTIHFLFTTGAVFGSGSGKAGAIIAFLLGLLGVFIAFPTFRAFKRGHN